MKAPKHISYVKYYVSITYRVLGSLYKLKIYIRARKVNGGQNAIKINYVCTCRYINVVKLIFDIREIRDIWQCRRKSTNITLGNNFTKVVRI